MYFRMDDDWKITSLIPIPFAIPSLMAVAVFKVILYFEPDLSFFLQEHRPTIILVMVLKVYYFLLFEIKSNKSSVPRVRNEFLELSS